MSATENSFDPSTLPSNPTFVPASGFDARIDANTMYSQIAEQEEERLRILKLREEFSTTNIQMMADKREMMNRQEHIWALFSFNNVENKNGCNGGVYEILESHDIIYISGLPRGVHIRDALNAHFSGNDGLVLGKYLSTQGGDLRKFSVRFMLSDQPREDARQLLRYYQLSSKGAVPKFN